MNKRKICEHKEKFTTKKLMLLVILLIGISYISCINVTTTNAATNSASSKALKTTAYVGKTMNLYYYLKEVIPSDSIYYYSNITYTSANKKLLTVDNKGNVKGIKKGSTFVIITASYKYWKKTKTEKFKVAVEVVSYDGSISTNNLYYSCYKGKITITGLKGNPKNVVIPKQIYGFPVTSISENAFENCTNLKSVKLCDSVSVIKDSAFYNCKSLNDVEFGKSISTIEQRAFYGCSSLTEMDMPSGIKTISEESFYGCLNLTKIEIPEGVQVIESDAFTNCKALENVELPNSVTDIESEAFLGCSSLKRIVIPDSVKKIGDYAFSHCTNLYDFNINQDIEREVGSGIFIETPYDVNEIAYAKNMTFQFTKYDWEGINLLLDTKKDMNIQDIDTDVEKIRKVHDWMVINTSYSYKQFEIYNYQIGTERTVLEKHFGICAGYSEVFKQFMDLLNIECIVISSERMNHAWNMVKLDDGCWYHVDVTWDDPGWNDDVWEKGWLSYQHLVRDDAGISEDHSDWEADAPVANGTKYLNYFDHSYIVQF